MAEQRLSESDSAKGSVLEVKQVNIAMDFYYPENVVSQYCESVAVVPTDREVYISFFQTEVAAGPNSPVPDKWHARCAARIVLSAAHFRELAKVMEGTVAQMDAAMAGGSR